MMRSTNPFPVVMAGLVPAIHVLSAGGKKGVDARDKPGHDGEEDARLATTLTASVGLLASAAPAMPT